MADKFFVLGSNSFSGSSFIDYLINNNLEVVGASRSAEIHPSFLPYRWSTKRKSSFQFYQLDLNHDLDKLMNVIREYRPDYVVNFAAQAMVAQSWLYPEQWFQTNVVANVRFHNQLRQLDFLKKYVHISTPEVYGNCDGLVKENQPFNPSTPYAVSRAACDMSLKTFLDAYQFPVVFTRAANVFGPGQQLYRIIPRTIFYIKLGKKIDLHGGGHSVRSFIHIRDVAEGTLKVAEQASIGEVYHFSTDRLISIRQLVEMICDIMGVKFDDHVNIAEERLGKDQAYQLDNTKSYNDLGWKAEISLEEGIQETIQWINDYFDDLKNQPFDYIHKP